MENPYRPTRAEPKNTDFASQESGKQVVIKFCVFTFLALSLVISIAVMVLGVGSLLPF